MGCIHLLQMGAIPQNLYDTIALGIEEGLGLPVQTHPPHNLPEHTYDVTRGQYHATRLLEMVETLDLPLSNRVIALTTVDLFIPILTFVFGEARLNAPGAVLSLHRLTPEFYGLPKNDALTAQRATIEAVHELGHTLGLIHCEHYPCAMHASRTADDIDLKSPQFCTDCATHLHNQNLKPSVCT